jgi:SAM-dependent methyltransferase
MARPNKFVYYEASVQEPEAHVALFGQFFSELRGRQALSLREDFCGTFAISKTWVKQSPRHTALALDLDAPTLQEGRRRHWNKLRPDQRRRLAVLNQDVRSVTAPKVDVVGVGNFSFLVFKKREDLVRYFKAAHRSLRRDGILVLETAGGGGMMEDVREQMTFRRNGDFWFRYFWRQKQFDPITHHGIYTISFKLRDGRLLRDAFVYDWRLWTLPETRQALIDAGFSDVKFYFEVRDRHGRGNGEYRLVQKGEYDHSWICFVVGVR